jgi:hypothetical protein
MSTSREEARLLARMGGGFGMQSDKNDGKRVERHVQTSIDRGVESILSKQTGNDNLTAEVRFKFGCLFVVDFFIFFISYVLNRRKNNFQLQNLL